MLSWREENAAPWKWLGWGHDSGTWWSYLHACKTTRLNPTPSSDTYFFHHINNNSLSHSSFSHPPPPLQTHMKCGWMGNYYVVNITHPNACSFNEIDTKQSDEYVCKKRRTARICPNLLPPHQTRKPFQPFQFTHQPYHQPNSECLVKWDLIFRTHHLRYGFNCKN